MPKRWLMILAGLGLVVALVTGFGWVLLFEPYCARWGATRAELLASLPGDELLSEPVLVTTRAITLEAPPEAVWPWLVQLGSGRAGWYSLDWLDNGGVPSAREILPRYQGLKVGDRLPMTPDGQVAMPVLELSPPHWLILGGEPGRDPGATEAQRASRWRCYWTIYLAEATPGRTRLVSRSRYAYAPDPFMDFAMRHWLVTGSWLMEREMLKGLAARVRP